MPYVPRLIQLRFIAFFAVLISSMAFAIEPDSSSSPPLNNSHLIEFQNKQLLHIGEQLKIIASTPRDDLEKSQIEKEDLKAQKDMAEWARLMFWATAVSVIIGIIGTAALLMTLFYTAKGLKTSTRALELSRKTAEDQLRAYIGATINKVTKETFEGNVFNFSVTLKNHGSTIARKVQNTMDIYFYPYDHDGDHVSNSSSKKQGPFDLMPSDTNNAQLFWETLSTERLSEIKKDLTDMKIKIYIEGDATYKDVFEKTHITKFRYCIFYHYDSSVAVEKCMVGNAAT